MKRKFSLSSHPAGGMLMCAALLMSLSTTAVAETSATQAASAVTARKAKPAAPVFLNFNYQGEDAVYRQQPLESGEFYTPLLQGCYPDPSICRKGDDYYMVTSTFAIFPGVPIFHSKDLVNWRQIGHVLDRVSQLELHDCGISAGVYAPTIRYNPHNDTFYMITTEFSGGFGNIVVKTQDPLKGWSDPVKLEFNGIDPDLFFDEDGKAYIAHNDAPDPGKEQYSGHRVIKVWDYDVEKDQVVPGSDVLVVDGGTDIRQKPVWIEAPHIYKRNGKYYLMCAQGGTGGNHTEVIFMSDHVKGPYVPAKNNPILTQKYYHGPRPFRVDWAGHADIVDTPDGRHYGVFLAVRPNEQGVVNTGRETFMLPVDWTGTYPVFENGLIPFTPKLRLPAGVENKCGQDGFMPNGNFTWNTDFAATYTPAAQKQYEKAVAADATQAALAPLIDHRWVAMRGPREAFISPAKKGGLQINPMASDITAVAPVSALFMRQQHACFTAQTSMQYLPKTDGEIAGLTCYQSEQCNFVFGLTCRDGKLLLTLRKTACPRNRFKAEDVKTDEMAVYELTKDEAKLLAKQPLRLQVTARGTKYTFAYALPGSDSFTTLGGEQNGDILSTDVAGGFTGALVGMYARSAAE